MPNLLDHRILIVTGKGGVGKTTLCAALGVAASQLGANTLVVETSGARRIAALFGKRSEGYEPTTLGPRLSTLSITPKEAIEDYIVQQLHFRRLYKLIFENRVMGPFIDAVPGLHDAVQLGKVWDLERQTRNDEKTWDLIIVDAPATGHGLTLLDAPAAMAELTRSGPMHRAVEQVRSVIEDPEKTALLLVTLPESIPVSETIELARALPPNRQEQIAATIVNEVWPERLSTKDATARLSESESQPVAEAATVLLRWIRRCEEQDASIQRIQSEMETPIVSLPFLVERQLTPKHLGELAEALTPLFGSRESA